MKKNDETKMQLFEIQHFISSVKARAILIWQLLTVSILKLLHLFLVRSFAGCLVIRSPKEHKTDNKTNAIGLMVIMPGEEKNRTRKQLSQSLHATRNSEWDKCKQQFRCKSKRTKAKMKKKPPGEMQTDGSKEKNGHCWIFIETKQEKYTQRKLNSSTIHNRTCERQSKKKTRLRKARNKWLGKRKTSLNVFPHFIPFLRLLLRRIYIHSVVLRPALTEYPTEKCDQMKQKPTFQIMYIENTQCIKSFV